MKFNAEMIERAKTAKHSDELLAMAKENAVAMTEEEAKTLFAQLNPESGEICDDELDNVAGGGCGDSGDSEPALYYGRFKEGMQVMSAGASCGYYSGNICGKTSLRGTIHFLTSDKNNSPWQITCAACGAVIYGTGDPNDNKNGTIFPDST